jgi:carbon monoxide dehydrogenase subunit G
MTAQERIAASRASVWEALNDPDVLRRCIPGCESLNRETPDRLLASVAIKIGPIGARFNGLVAISDVDPAHGYTLTAEGQGGTIGSVKSTIKVRLTDDGSGTLLAYDVDAQVGGRLAQLGGPIIDATAKQFAAKFFNQLSAIVGGSKNAAALSNAAPRAASSGTSAPASSPLPIAWILALALASLAGFLVGRGQNGTGGSDWMGIAIGLLIVVVAAVAFEFGRRTAAPRVVLDSALLQRLLREDKP